jgi:uncharacterized membrane protein (UPF0127 family)
MKRVRGKSKNKRRIKMIPRKSLFKEVLLSVNSLLFTVFCLLPTVYCLLLSSCASADSPSQVCFHDQCFTVEIMDTQEKRSLGLQGRTSLPADQGMLFIFPMEDILNFWMKDTLIALDMVWINDGHVIVDIKTDIQPCIKEPCPIYVPSGKARYVLEVNASFAQAHGLKVGDQVVIK